MDANEHQTIFFIISYYPITFTLHNYIYKFGYIDNGYVFRLPIKVWNTRMYILGYQKICIILSPVSLCLSLCFALGRHVSGIIVVYTRVFFVSPKWLSVARDSPDAATVEPRRLQTPFPRPGRLVFI